MVEKGGVYETKGIRFVQTKTKSVAVVNVFRMRGKWREWQSVWIMNPELLVDAEKFVVEEILNVFSKPFKDNRGYWVTEVCVTVTARPFVMTEKKKKKKNEPKPKQSSDVLKEFFGG